MSYAGFWKRLAAFIIDMFVSAIGGFLIGFVILYMLIQGGSVESEAELDSISRGIGLLLTWLYFAIMESSQAQATLGKMALGIKVADLYGNRIGFGRATGRFFGKFISAIILYIGFLMAAFTSKKQALHDFMASCLVVNKA